MKKFKNLFWVGFIMLISPFVIFALMFLLSTLNEPSEKFPKEEHITIYDTVKVKVQQQIFDTVKVEKIKWVEKSSSDTTKSTIKKIQKDSIN